MNTDPTAMPDPAPPDIDAVEDAPAVPRPTGQVCGNCGTPTFGEYCYHCGQPDHGLVRHFSSVMGDLLDTVLQIDTRLTRTLAPLLLRPGFLSIEYFAGRRVRYVSPVRLFFFIAVVAFFVAQWSVDASGGSHLVQVDNDSINSATTVAAVEQKRDQALQGLHTGVAAVGDMPGVAKQLTRDEEKIRKRADARIAEINAAKAEGKPPPDHDNDVFSVGDAPWDPVKNPIHFDSAPAFANKWLNQMAAQAQGNFARIQKQPLLLFDAWLSAMPSTLFVLLPLFAVLLKLVYFFKRRLYMEHFIVALHSHAFLCFALLLVLVLIGLEGVAASWMLVPIEVAKALLIIWMPVYLLLMQKRVYAQGWIMTTLKYFAIGTVYMVMLSLGVAATFVVKLVWL